MLELDHVFCLVADPDCAVRHLEDDGWVLDAGQAHHGQGTRNRRLACRGMFVELLWVIDPVEARANPLRLDRRADWTATGASPFGLAFRGQIDPGGSDEFWLYDALGPRIWVHRDNERHPERPMVLVLEATDEERERRRARPPTPGARVAELQEIRVHGPSPPTLPPVAGPPLVHVAGTHLLELVLADGGAVHEVSDIFVIRR